MTDNWTEKYAPESLEEMVVSDENRGKLNKIMTDLPTTLLYGNAGTGKSSFMKILQKLHRENILKINASDENGVDVIRDKVNSFAVAAPFDLKSTKIVYFEEADKLTEEAQNALKDLIEQVKKKTRFFFVCNDNSKIIDPIKSRCGYKLNLDDPPIEKILEHVWKILDSEHVEVKNTDDVKNIINKYYPDIRNIINTLESHEKDGVLNIDPDILSEIRKDSALKTAEQRREADRLRAQRWREKQKMAGKKQISGTISGDAFEILQNIEGNSYGEKIEKLLLNHAGKK